MRITVPVYREQNSYDLTDIITFTIENAQPAIIEGWEQYSWFVHPTIERDSNNRLYLGTKRWTITELATGCTVTQSGESAEDAIKRAKDNLNRVGVGRVARAFASAMVLVNDGLAMMAD